MSPQTWLAEEVGAVILAGGRSTRMGGTDKAFLRVGGQAVVERTLHLLRAAFPEVVIVSNQPDKYAQFGVPVARDDVPYGGPLAGMQVGLRLLQRPYAFVVACDMPFLQRAPIAYLVERIRAQEAIIPRWEDDIEPLHAVYATALAPRIAAALDAGVRAIRDFLPSVDAEYVAEAAMRTIPGAEESFRNVNTPEEAARFAIAVGPAPARDAVP